MSTLRSHPLLLGVAPTEEAAAVASRRARPSAKTPRAPSCRRRACRDPCRCRDRGGGLARATAVEATLTSRGARRHRHALHSF
jgi:hypothetical protein